MLRSYDKSAATTSCSNKDEDNYSCGCKGSSSKDKSKKNTTNKPCKCNGKCKNNGNCTCNGDCQCNGNCNCGGNLDKKPGCSFNKKKNCASANKPLENKGKAPYSYTTNCNSNKTYDSYCTKVNPATDFESKCIASSNVQNSYSSTRVKSFDKWCNFEGKDTTSNLTTSATEPLDCEKNITFPFQSHCEEEYDNPYLTQCENEYDNPCNYSCEEEADNSCHDSYKNERWKFLNYKESSSFNFTDLPEALTKEVDPSYDEVKPSFEGFYNTPLLSFEEDSPYQVSFNPEDPFEFTIEGEAFSLNEEPSMPSKPFTPSIMENNYTLEKKDKPSEVSLKSNFSTFSTSSKMEGSEAFQSSCSNSSGPSSSTICDCYCQYEYTFDKKHTEFIKGGSSFFELYKKDCEIRVDVSVKATKGCILYGEVNYKDCSPAKGVVVTLLKSQCVCGRMNYVRVASALTDAMGAYEFFLPEDFCCGDFKILLGKAVC